MKLYKHYLIAACTLFLSGCSSDYLDTIPTDKTPEESIKGTVDNLYSALNGTHRAMYIQYDNQSSQAGESSMNITRDMLGEDLVNSATANGWFISDARWINHRNENSNMLRYTFNYYYKLILNANLILESINTAAGEDDVLRNGIKGEAFCFRAFSHFQLVQLFGKRYEAGTTNNQLGITYRVTSPIEKLPRNTVEDVYTRINADLDSAILCLGTYNAENVNHFSLKVAYGLKARVALVQGNWNAAATYADKAITTALADGNMLQTGSELLKGFVIAGENKEWMWASIMTDNQTIYFYSFFSFMSWNFNSTNIRSNPKLILNHLYNHITPTDIRSKWWDPTGLLPGPSSSFLSVKYQNRKFTAKSPSTSVGDILYMRLPEMYLIKAEALARSGNDADADIVLKQLMVTRNPDYVTTASGNDLIKEILLQRRIELWGEGFRFTDLKRLNEPLNRLNSNHIESVSQQMEVSAGNKLWQFLIPKREIETNPFAVQNEI